MSTTPSNDVDPKNVDPNSVDPNASSQTLDQALAGSRILLGISGGIAAYKTPILVRQLRQLGAEVQVVLTAGAQQFVTPTSLQAVSGHPVRSDLWDPAAEASMGHIELARWADLVLIAPATANLLASLSRGQAPDLLTTLYLATSARVMVAPAMNQAMWSHPAVQRNVDQLRADGVTIVGPAEGEQACGDNGLGRMEEPEVLVATVIAALKQTPPSSSAGSNRQHSDLAAVPAPSSSNSTLTTGSSLAGCNVLITAGPTREAIDPVRYISNHSSGKQGYALAAAAAQQGANVTLVSGPVNLPCPSGVNRIDVTSAEEMHQTVQQHVAKTDIFIGVAAVADYRPQSAAAQKIKKSSDNSERAAMQLSLVENPDIIAAVAKHANAPFVVGFAAETHNPVAFARDKLTRKKLDMILVNDVSDNSIGFGSDSNAVTMIWASGERTLPRQPKIQLAAQIVAEIARQYVAQLATTNRQPAVN